MPRAWPKGFAHAASSHAPEEALFHAPGERPAVYSVSRSEVFAHGMAGAALAAALARCVEGIRNWSSGQHYLIGHIKVFAENGLKDHLWLATTGKEIRVQPSEGWDTASCETFQVHFTAIVFGPSQEHLASVVAEFLQHELDAIRP